MRGGYTPPRDERSGWTAEVRCPHGQLFLTDLELLLRPWNLRDECGEAQAERAEAAKKIAPPGRLALWRETRRFRRQLEGGSLARWLRGKLD